MSSTQDRDPMPGIRSVLIVGCLASNVAALLLVGLQGGLYNAVRLNPLGAVGAALLIGLAGTMVGAIFGLSLRLAMGQRDQRWGWPIVAACIGSAIVGLLIAQIIVEGLW